MESLLCTQEQQGIEEYSPALIRLFQGVVYSEDKIWELLVQYQEPIKKYFAKLALDVIMAEGDGFAYLKQRDEPREVDQGKSLPRLIRRVSLSYDVTVMALLLRERLHQFEIEGSDSTRLVLSKDQIREMVVLFFKEKANEVKLFKNIDAIIQKIVDLGFLRRLNVAKTEEYEVMRILKARFNIDVLQELKNKLKNYTQTHDNQDE